MVRAGNWGAQGVAQPARCYRGVTYRPRWGHPRYTETMLRSLRSEVSTRDRIAALRLVLIAYALFSFLDWITTATALAQGGRERNPIAASLYAQYGSPGLLLFKVLVVALIIGVFMVIPRRVMSLRIAVWVATAFVAFTALAVIGNVHALASLTHSAGQYQSVPETRSI
jgi:Domain of unknown function (DUF5658)